MIAKLLESKGVAIIRRCDLYACKTNLYITLRQLYKVISMSVCSLCLYESLARIHVGKQSNGVNFSI